MPRQHIGDGFTKLDIVKYDLWSDVTVAQGGGMTDPIQRIFHSPDFSPTLILEWDAGGSPDFDVELWTYFNPDDSIGDENEKIKVITGLDSTGTTGTSIAIQRLGFSSPIVYGWGELYIVNNDAGADLNSVSGLVYQENKR